MDDDMWSTQELELGSDTRHYTLHNDRGPLTVRGWIDLTITNGEFRSYFNRVLAQNTFAGYFWETPAATLTSLDDPFEWVLVESKGLPRMRPEPEAFERHFDSNLLATSFANLGGDSMLIAPTPRGQAEMYVHLATFTRGASEAQVDAFWQLVAAEFQRSLGHEQRWLSTSGLGVGWLHVRIDRRPKYYNHEPYTQSNQP